VAGVDLRRNIYRLLLPSAVLGQHVCARAGLSAAVVRADVGARASELLPVSVLLMKFTPGERSR
jgi:hypothetical protein